MNKKNIVKMLDTLEKELASGEFLEYTEAWQLLFATILSAQCTDARVNVVTSTLFVKYPDPEAFAHAELKELEEDIRPTGFYHNKAKNLISCAKTLVEKYNGVVPSDIDELTSLAGVGRKTANVVRGNIFNIPSVVVDTHVGRVSRRLGLTDSTDPEKAEYDLMRVIPKDRWISVNHLFMNLGRSICTSRKAYCDRCPISEICPKCGVEND